MQKAFIIFSSITYAQLAAEALRRHSVYSKIGRLKSGGVVKSCSYVLYPSCEISRALEILKIEGIKNNGVGRGDEP